MNVRYTIVLKSPMGPKEGYINIEETDNCIEGTLECLGGKHPLWAGAYKKGHIVLDGMLQSPLGEEPFTIEGSTNENILTATFKRRNEKYEVVGMKVEPDENKKREEGFTWKRK